MFKNDFFTIKILVKHEQVVQEFIAQENFLFSIKNFDEIFIYLFKFADFERFQVKRNAKKRAKFFCNWKRKRFFFFFFLFSSELFFVLTFVV